MGIERPIYLCAKNPYAGAHHLPLITSEPLHVTIAWHHYDVLVLTSKETIRLLGAYAVPWERLQILAVSDQTAQAAKRCGACHVMSGAGNGEQLYEIIKNRYADQKILYLGESIRRVILPNGYAPRGCRSSILHSIPPAASTGRK